MSHAEAPYPPGRIPLLSHPHLSIPGKLRALRAFVFNYVKILEWSLPVF
jgi:hypothetical protein